MSWIERPDNVACCGDTPGSVACDEQVARLLHSKIDDPDILAFSRKELTGDGIKNPSNVCGEADGLSVDRAGGLSEDELRQLSNAQAERRPGRDGKGAWVANVAALRAITHASAPEGAVRVYDDPMPDNDRHAVVRVADTISRTDFNEIRRAVMTAFAKRVA